MIPCSKKRVNVAQRAWAGVLRFMMIPGALTSLNSVRQTKYQCLFPYGQGCVG